MYINSIRRSRENLHSLLDEGGNLVTKDKEKVEMSNGYFASVFVRDTSCSAIVQSLEMEDGQRAESSPHSPGGNDQGPIVPLRCAQVYLTGGSPPKNI